VSQLETPRVLTPPPARRAGALRPPRVEGAALDLGAEEEEEGGGGGPSAAGAAALPRAPSDTAPAAGEGATEPATDESAEREGAACGGDGEGAGELAPPEFLTREQWALCAEAERATAAAAPAGRLEGLRAAVAARPGPWQAWIGGCGTPPASLLRSQQQQQQRRWLTQRWSATVTATATATARAVTH
jgi:hypothetical protein